MSEYIKKLAEQAGMEWDTHSWCWLANQPHLEKFAELIRAEEKPEWQELHKDEIKQILNDGEEWSSLEFAQAVSDLLREKNK
jgi:hypothetical protein